MIPEKRETATEDPKQRLLYPMPEAAELLGGITERKLRMMIVDKEIKCTRIGRRVFISAGQLAEYVAEREKADA
jgi:excisionase family DNA binding protein